MIQGDENGAIVCTPCGQGQYANLGKECKDTDNGYYAFLPHLSPDACPAGTYSAGDYDGENDGDQTCYPCGPGTLCYANSTSATGNRWVEVPFKCKPTTTL